MMFALVKAVKSLNSAVEKTVNNALWINLALSE